MSDSRPAGMLSNGDFARDEASGVWIPRNGATKFNYQDGDEAQLLAKISSCADRSRYSSEFYPYRSWSQEYHLSPVRGNILAPLEDVLGPGARVLEIGAGCGAITRALGELGCVVHAVEGSLDRACIAAARCRDLPGVRVYCSDFGRVDLGVGSYDVVTLIGVLEYAALFFDTAPFETMLSMARRHLDAQGRLFVAIENQLGLKYFKGMPEDHVGVPFYGIQGLYQKGRRTPQTFTRKSLGELIERSGLPQAQFCYPFPDYKLPTAVLTEAAFAHAGLSAFQIVSGCRDRRHPGHAALFHEASVLQTLQQGGLGQHFANSLAVVASRASLATPKWLAKTYANRRRSQYCTETSIESGAGGLRVSKRPLCPAHGDAKEVSRLVENVLPGGELFHEGNLLSFELTQALYLPVRDAWPEFRRLLAEWVGFLKDNADASQHLDGSYYDAVPQNLMRVEGSLRYFDAEWKVKRPIPVLLPVIRGVVGTLGSVDEEVWIAKLPHPSLRALCLEVLAGKGISAAPEEFDECIRLDAEVHEAVYPALGSASYKAEIENALFRDLRRISLRKSAKVLLGAIRSFVRSTPVLGDAIASLRSMVRK